MSSEYEIQRSIGIGSFGQVFLAIKKKTKQQCVIKKIKIRDITEIERKNIENEVKLLQDLKHINIVGYKDSYIDKEGNLNIVMENCQGGDMYQKIRSTNGKRFEETDIIDWFIQICLALHYMHEKRILHRDLKTQNIFLTEGKVRLGDFGISKVLDEKQQLTNTVIGTPYYMSPEQFRFKPYNYKTDIWALGCLLYEMCNLRHAFDAQNLSALSVKVLKGNYPPVNSQYSKPLRDLIGKLLSLNCKDRPTILDILKLPFLRKQLAMYIQSCIKKDHGKENYTESLIEQAKILGLQFMDSIPEIHSEHMIKSERGEISSQHGSAKISRKSSRELLDKKALENRKKVIEKELDREEKEKGKLESEYKKEEAKVKVDKRQEILDKDKERRNKILSQNKFKSDSTPNLLLMKVKKQNMEMMKSENSSSQLINQYKSIPLKQVTTEEKPQPEYYSNVSPPPYQPDFKEKAFKMQQQYDMNFQDQEQPPVEEKHQTIYQILQMQEQYPPKKPTIQSIIPIEIQQQIPPQQSIQMADVINMVNAVKEQLKTKTQKIDSLKSELLQINFDISEDSIHYVAKTVNPKYEKVQEKINSLREKMEGKVTSKQYELLKRVLGNQKENMSVNEHGDFKLTVSNILGEGALGYWHIMDQILIFEEALKHIPEYL